MNNTKFKLDHQITRQSILKVNIILVGTVDFEYWNQCYRKSGYIIITHADIPMVYGLDVKKESG